MTELSRNCDQKATRHHPHLIPHPSPRRVLPVPAPKAEEQTDGEQ